MKTHYSSGASTILLGCRAGHLEKVKEAKEQGVTQEPAVLPTRKQDKNTVSFLSDWQPSEASTKTCIRERIKERKRRYFTQRRKEENPPRQHCSFHFLRTDCQFLSVITGVLRYVHFLLPR